MGVIENGIQNSIKDYINMTGGTARRMQSGKIIQSYENKKTGKINMRAINMEEKGTPDLVLDIRSKCIWVEVKKDKEEYEKWISLEKRLNEEGKIPKSYHREEAQIREKRRLERRGSIYILTYSLQHFIYELKNYI